MKPGYGPEIREMLAEAENENLGSFSKITP